jgi:HAD superfamily 5'-nucleotidase-like hydrolase
LAHRQTVDKLVKAFGYPEALYCLAFDYRYMMRGLVIDKRRGNMLKVDRHKYVKLAFHGFEPLTREQRMQTYNNADKREEFDEPDFALIDTLFSLAEAHLFMQLVEMKDEGGHALLERKSFADIYRDVRGAVDLCHRDGSIKREVAANPERYIHDDPGLVPLLEMLRASGKKLFVATNSLWDYTHVVMNWVISKRKGAERTEDWLKYFDVVRFR